MCSRSCRRFAIDSSRRTEENRELLKMKIEMMRNQLEVERRQGDSNWSALA